MADVLLVDDSTMLRLLVSYTLSGADGFSVTESPSARDALERLELEDFSLMLTDFHMPGVDGVQLVREVRKMPRHEELPIIMMTADTDPIVEREAREAGVDGFIVKPFEPGQLHAEIRRMMEGSMMAQNGSVPHRFGPQNLIEAFPYPAMVLTEEHDVVMGNRAFYDLTGTGISDCPPKCHAVMHGEHGMPDSCPLERAARTWAPAEVALDDPLRGKLHVWVYPLDPVSTGGKRLFLHLARPLTV